MKVKVYKSETGSDYHICFTCGYDLNTISAMVMDISCDEETLKNLHQQLGEIIPKKEVKEEIVWNPRSKRHEVVRK